MGRGRLPGPRAGEGTALSPFDDLVFTTETAPEARDVSALTQARPFHERRGYRVFATLDDCPAGHQRFFLGKTLRA
jgi:hypothetical protein